MPDLHSQWSYLKMKLSPTLLKKLTMPVHGFYELLGLKPFHIDQLSYERLSESLPLDKRELGDIVGQLFENCLENTAESPELVQLSHFIEKVFIKKINRVSWDHNLIKQFFTFYYELVKIYEYAEQNIYRAADIHLMITCLITDIHNLENQALSALFNELLSAIELVTEPTMMNTPILISIPPSIEPLYPHFFDPAVFENARDKDSDSIMMGRSIKLIREQINKLPESEQIQLQKYLDAYKALNPNSPTLADFINNSLPDLTPGMYRALLHVAGVSLEKLVETLTAAKKIDEQKFFDLLHLLSSPLEYGLEQNNKLILQVTRLTGAQKGKLLTLLIDYEEDRKAIPEVPTLSEFVLSHHWAVDHELGQFLAKHIQIKLKEINLFNALSEIRQNAEASSTPYQQPQAPETAPPANQNIDYAVFQSKIDYLLEQLLTNQGAGEKLQRWCLECELLALHLEYNQPLDKALLPYISPGFLGPLCIINLQRLDAQTRLALATKLLNISDFMPRLDALNLELWQNGWPFENGFLKSSLYSYLKTIHANICSELIESKAALDDIEPGYETLDLAFVFPSFVPVVPSNEDCYYDFDQNSEIILSHELKTRVFNNYLDHYRPDPQTLPLSRNEVEKIFLDFVVKRLLSSRYLAEKHFFDGVITVLEVREIANYSQNDLSYLIRFSTNDYPYEELVYASVDLHQGMYREAIFPAERNKFLKHQQRLFQPNNVLSSSHSQLDSAGVIEHSMK